MKPFKTILYFVLIVVITLFTINCVSNFAGGTGDVDNKTICGKLLEPDGINPAQGAFVYLRSRDYLPGLKSLLKRSEKDTANNSNFVRSTHTNGSGYYEFDKIPEGLYCIEGRDNGNNCVLIDSIKIDSTLNNIDSLLLQDTLKPPATVIIEGKIQPYNDSTQAFIRVFGLDVYEKVSSNGNFYLYDLPEGNLKLRITIIRGDLKSYDTMEIATKANDTTIILPGIKYNGNENTAGIVTDIDGNVYHTVTIGTQTWTVENLRTTKFNDGTAIRDSITGDTLAGYCWYNNDSATYKSTYGALYNWYTVNTGKLAPAGWHAPTDREWDILQNYLIANGYNCDCDGTTITNMIAKSLAAKKDWISYTAEGSIGCDLTKNNASGFSALPGGLEGSDGNSYAIGRFAGFWSTTEFDTSKALTRDLYNGGEELVRTSIYKSYGLSVRLLRD
jgi:uncharacterized protein (TIGR02145 family)